MFSGLRRKFVWTVMVISTVLLCVLLSAIYRITATQLAAENIQIMQSVSTERGPTPPGPDVPHPHDRLYYFVLTRDLHGTLQVTGNGSFDLSDLDLLESLYTIAAESPDYTGRLWDYSLRYLRVEQGPRTSYVFMDISEELSNMRTLRSALILIGLLSVAVLYGLTRILVDWMVRPVEESYRQQKQFVADASHELKTPLTVILTNTELLQSPEYSPAQRWEFTSNIMTMAQRMKSLVESMLDLARVDNGIAKSALEELDWSELAESALLPFEPLFFESGRMLESQIEEQLQVVGSRRHLEQLVGILLDNAMKYSPEGSTVVLTLRRQGRSALLCVDSEGAEIPPAELENIFHRFYTVDKARTGDSYGLGLPIAHGIVQELGGRIWAESCCGHNRFYVTLPLK